MANIKVNEATHSVEELSFLPQPGLAAEAAGEISGMEASGGPEGVTDSEVADVGTACYMCHACTNFGVHGKEVRPCARGLSDLINRRHKARMSTKAGRGSSI